jgi:hypothetical protein
LSEGVNTYSVTAKDMQNNESGASSISITLDTTAPSVPVITSPANNLVTTNASQTIIGTCASDTSQILANGSASNVTYTGGETSWSYAASLSEGANTYSVTARDAQNNESGAVAITITLEITPPEVPEIPSPENDPTTAPATQTTTVTSETTTPEASLSASVENTPTTTEVSQTVTVPSDTITPEVSVVASVENAPATVEVTQTTTVLSDTITPEASIAASVESIPTTVEVSQTTTASSDTSTPETPVAASVESTPTTPMDIGVVNQTATAPSNTSTEEPVAASAQNTPNNTEASQSVTMPSDTSTPLDSVTTVPENSSTVAEVSQKKFVFFDTEKKVGISIEIPAGAIPAGKQIFTQLLDKEIVLKLLSTLPPGSEYVVGLDINLEGFSEVIFNKPAKIMLELNQRLEDNLRVFVWNKKELRWDDAKISNVVVMSRSVTFNTMSFSRFVVMTMDTSGPEIGSITLNSQTVIDGDYAKSKPTISAVLRDTDAGIISWKVEIKNYNTNAVVDSKTEILSSATTAEVTAAFTPTSALSAGKYFVTITATDNANNSASSNSKYFEVPGSAFTLSALNGPNPFSPNSDGMDDTTKISYQLSSDAEVKIRLHSISGELLYSWDYALGNLTGGHAGYNETVWNGVNIFNELVPNGIYLCYIQATDSSGNKGTEKIKIAVLK